MRWESVWKASVTFIGCLGVALGAMGCGKRSTQAGGSCAPPSSRPQIVATSRSGESFGEYASDGKYIYVIVGAENTARLDRIPLDGGSPKTLIPSVGGAWQPELYGPIALTRTSLVVQRSIVAGERFNTMVLSTYMADVHTEIARRALGERRLAEPILRSLLLEKGNELRFERSDLGVVGRKNFVPSLARQ